VAGIIAGVISPRNSPPPAYQQSPLGGARAAALSGTQEYRHLHSRATTSCAQRPRAGRQIGGPTLSLNMPGTARGAYYTWVRQQHGTAVARASSTAAASLPAHYYILLLQCLPLFIMHLLLFFLPSAPLRRGGRVTGGGDGSGEGRQEGGHHCGAPGLTAVRYLMPLRATPTRATLNALRSRCRNNINLPFKPFSISEHLVASTHIGRHSRTCGWTATTIIRRG